MFGHDLDPGALPVWNGSERIVVAALTSVKWSRQLRGTLGFAAVSDKRIPTDPFDGPEICMLRPPLPPFKGGEQAKGSTALSANRSLAQ
jgi:hypothetical protein